MTNNYELNDEELVDLTNENSPNQRCLNSLMIEVYKWLNGLSSDIMNDVLAVSKYRYNTRYYNLFLTDHPKRDSLIAILNSELNFNFFCNHIPCIVIARQCYYKTKLPQN